MKKRYAMFAMLLFGGCGLLVYLAWEAGGDGIASRPAWADLVLIPFVEAKRLSRQELAECPIPLIIQDDGRAAGMSSEAARPQCEQLQREIVDLGDFAGYMV